LAYVLAWWAAVFALVGVVQQFIGTVLVARFVDQPGAVSTRLQPVTVLKPLCGVDPLTELALESFFLLDYPEYQLVFGVQSASDPVLQILAMLQARYPTHDVALVVEAALHGTNRKISNLINMLRKAKHETLVMSDADIHVPPYFLRRFWRGGWEGRIASVSPWR
jgi:ceramide glucosyltransferase